MSEVQGVVSHERRPRLPFYRDSILICSTCDEEAFKITVTAEGRLIADCRGCGTELLCTDPLGWGGFHLISRRVRPGGVSESLHAGVHEEGSGGEEGRS